MIPDKAFQLAHEGGYKSDIPWDFWEKHALNPEFFKALGIGLGNKDEMRCDSPKCDTVQCEYAGYKDPHRMYENFCSIIWYGGDTDKFWHNLLPTKE